MRRTFLGAIGVFLVSSLAALVTWLVLGPPDRSVACDPADLGEGQICLSEVRAWEADSYLWVDARPRKLWQKNGVSGSVLLTDDNSEDFLRLEEDFMEAAYREGEPYPRIVIYCNEEGCGSSKAIAAGIREKFAEMMGFEVFVLYGGWKALAADDA